MEAWSGWALALFVVYEGTVLLEGEPVGTGGALGFEKLTGVHRPPPLDAPPPLRPLRPARRLTGRILRSPAKSIEPSAEARRTARWPSRVSTRSPTPSQSCTFLAAYRKFARLTRDQHRFINQQSDLISQVLHVPHYPLLHSPRRQVVWFYMLFRSAMATESELARQFVLIDGYNTTPDDFLASLASLVCPITDAEGRCRHTREVDGQCPWEKERRQNYTKVVKKYVAEDAARRKGLTADEHARLPATVRLICLSNDGTMADDDPISRDFSVSWVTTMSLNTVNDSTLDPRNIDVPWLDAMKASPRGARKEPESATVRSLSEGVLQEQSVEWARGGKLGRSREGRRRGSGQLPQAHGPPRRWRARRRVLRGSR